MLMVQIRRAVREDLGTLRDIQWAAGQRYRHFELEDFADREPASVEVLGAYADDGRAWVSVGAFDQIIGFIIVDIIDGGAHIEHVSVMPTHQGQGIGRALIEHVERWSISRGMRALTLTTFGNIPWNRPLYEHLGFRVLPQDQFGPGIQSLWEAETHHGLDPDARVVMRLDL
jgi:GNAT superfamily N-acetyltransferase